MGGEMIMIFGGLYGGSSNKARKTLTHSAKNPHIQATLVMQCDDAPQEEHYPMMFTEEEARTVYHPHNDGLVITLVTTNRRTDRVLIDSSSSADIIFLDTFDEMGLNRSDVRCVET